MIRIAAVLPRTSYAPELFALSDYLYAKRDVSLELLEQYPAGSDRTFFDVVYIKMGFAPRWHSSDILEIHDYASASGGKYAAFKDFSKTHLSRRPVLRSFLSNTVRGRFPFRDSVPYVLRDMGVPDAFLRASALRTESFTFDLLYAGSISDSRKTDQLLHAVESSGLTILVVGDPQPSILSQFRNSANVTFAGRLPYMDMPSVAKECRFGVNFTPDVRPYNTQTSTKVLEYLAMGLPVITNDYCWVRDFEAQSGARLLKLSHISLLSPEVHRFDYHIPDMSKYTWWNVFEESTIHAKLLELI